MCQFIDLFNAPSVLKEGVRPAFVRRLRRGKGNFKQSGNIFYEYNEQYKSYQG